MRKNRSKSKMNTAKLGVMFIVAAMALAGIGAGYAAWFDTITVEGSVSTGSVEWEVSDVSETHVWKIHGLLPSDPYYNPDWGNEIYVDYAMLSEADIKAMFPGLFIEEISSSYVTVSADKHDVTVTYDNLFPCILFKADIVIEYTGTVPGKINDIFYNPTGGIDWIAPLIASGDIYAKARDVQGNVVELGYQLHENDLIHIELWVHIPQNNDLMLKSGGFTASFEVVQWNEYPYDGGECGDETSIGHHADVALCLDTSGSVTGTPLSDLKTASKAFVNVLVNDDGMVAIAAFNTTGYPIIALTDDQTALDAAIDGLNAGGTTNPGAGISIAQGYLETEPTTPDDRTDDSTYPDFMIIITDGNPVPAGDAPHILQATNAKAAGTKIYVLGIGSIDPTFCEALSSGTGYYFTMTNYGDLQNILLNLVTL